MEAMASGLPVIAANAGALGELVHHNVNGYLFTPGNIDELATYIKKILTNPSLQLSMKAKSLEIVKTHDITKTVATFEKIYTHFGAKKAAIPSDTFSNTEA
jgi:glycosyltransferase involved in cell wall biosynthesis